MDSTFNNLEQAIQVADQIARRYSSSTTWSTWHVWDALHHEPSLSSTPERLWDCIYPFTTCVGWCFSSAADLRAIYTSTPGLEHWAAHVQVLVSMERDESNPASEVRPRHCVVAIPTDEKCVLVDLVFEPAVIVIPIGESYETMPYITMSGRRGKRRFHYTRIDGELRLEFENAKRADAPRCLFRPIQHAEAVRELSAYGATLKAPGTDLPVNKTLIVRGIIRERPTKVPSFRLDAGAWMITTCRFQEDFGKRELTMQGRMEDWLLKERNRRYWWVQESEMFRRMEGVANLNVKVPLQPGECKLEEQLKLVSTIASCLGLPVADFDRIVESVREVWVGR